MIYSIPAGDSLKLQSALSSSQPGDEIVLPAGSRFVGTFVLPPKDNEVVLRCDYFTQIVEPSAITLSFPFTRRVTPADAGLMPRIASGSSGRAIDGTGARNWTLHGIRFEPNVGGYGEVLGFEGAENIILDCILLVVPEGQQQKRGVLGNGKQIMLTRSHLSGIWRSGQDSQAFAAWDGPGPYTITDNYLEAASENILFGGADASSPENIPADVRIEGNTLTKNLAWKGQQRNTKNLLEIKAGKRILIARNDLSHNWADAQGGFAVLFTVRNQDGTAPYTAIEDLTFEHNTVRDTPHGINITGHDDINTSGQTTGIVIRDNTIDTPGTGCLLHHGIGKLAVYRNDFGPATDRAIVSFDRGAYLYAVDDLIWAENAGGGYIHAPNEADYLGTPNAEKILTGYTRIYSLGVPTGEVSQPSTPELPSTPPVVEGLPSPAPGEPQPLPSVPDWEFDVLTERVDALSVEIERLKALLAKVVTLMDTAPNTNNTKTLAQHFRSVK